MARKAWGLPPLLFSQALDIQTTTGCKTVVDFVAAFKGREDIRALRADVNALATSFPMPGFDVAAMKYKGEVALQSGTLL